MPAPPGLDEQTRALLDLTREIADAELRPAADRGREVRDVPPAGVPDAGQGRAARPAVPGAAGRRRAALRGVPAGHRRAGPCLADGRAGRERAHPRLLPAGHGGHRRPAGAMAARRTRRRPARRLLPVRAALRVGRRGAADQRGSGRRPVRDRRGEGVDFARRAGGLLHAVRPHLRDCRRPRAQPGDQLPVRPGRRGRGVRGARRAQDGHARLDHGADAVLIGPGRARPPGGRGRPGVLAGAFRARLRTARHRRLLDRPGPGGAWRRR